MRSSLKQEGFASLPVVLLLGGIIIEAGLIGARRHIYQATGNALHTSTWWCNVEEVGEPGQRGNRIAPAASARHVRNDCFHKVPPAFLLAFNPPGRYLPGAPPAVSS